MKRFMVVVPEVHLRRYIVIADNPESATETMIMKGGNVEVEDSEFSHTLDTNEWEVYAVDDEGEIIT